MKIFVTLAIILSVLFMSCQKEISYEDPNGTGGTVTPTVGTQLIKIGQKSGSDTSTIQYSYNSSNRISGYVITGTSSGQQLNSTIDYVRNSSNVITQQVYKDPSLSQYGLTQVVTNYTYDASASQYKYALTQITIMGNTYKDSIAYNYDASNKLISTIDYENAGSGYAPFSKEEYSYSGSNLGSVKYYSYDDSTSNYLLDETHTFEYDSKVNPLKFVSDAPVLGMTTYYSANNVSKQTIVVTSPSSTQTVSTTYTYNTNNMPITGVLTAGTGSAVSTYYYQ
ncbi:MAG: hypothetical protein ACM3VS_00905 [Candidatus Dadabacteria bacterium]